MSVPATVINKTALVMMIVRRLAIGVLGIALDGGRETVDLAGPFSLDDISHRSVMEEVVVTLPMLDRYCRYLPAGSNCGNFLPRILKPHFTALHLIGFPLAALSTIDESFKNSEICSELTAAWAKGDATLSMCDYVTPDLGEPK